jgi:hypothetical protein
LALVARQGHGLVVDALGFEVVKVHGVLFGQGWWCRAASYLLVRSSI